MNNTTRQLEKYLVVGGAAALTEWLVFWICCNGCGMHFAVSTIAAFLIATFVNWILGRRMVFRAQAQNINIWKDILQVYMASLAGLFINIFLMFVFCGRMGLPEMCAKVIATGMVFVWNFGIRKYLIYKV